MRVEPIDRRRRALRRAVEIPVELISRHVDEPLLYWATDLTPYGMWIETPFPMQPGEEVVLCFQPAVSWAQRELIIFAEVERMTAAQGSGAGMGLSFKGMTPHEERALSSWLRWRPPPLPKRRCRSMNVRELPPPSIRLRAA